MGAYLSTFAPFIPTGAGTKVLASVYGFQAIHANVIGVLTNTVPVDAYRGAGRPESNYLVERLIDAAARELGIDRIELRQRNMVPQSAMPYVSAIGQRYDSGDFARVLDAALENADWAGFPARRAASEAKGKQRGIGVAYYLEATGGGPTERAKVRFAEGRLRRRAGRHPVHRPGPRDGLCHAHQPRAGHPDGKDPHRPGRFGRDPRPAAAPAARAALYSEGQAILLTAATVIEKGKQAAVRASGSLGGGHRIRRRRRPVLVVGTDRGIGILELRDDPAGARGEGRAAILLDADGEWRRSSPTPSPMAATSPRWRWTPTPG